MAFKVSTKFITKFSEIIIIIPAFITQFVAILAFAAFASATPIELDQYNNYHQPQLLIKQQPTLIKKVVHVEQDAPAHYEFKYDVHDAHTGDIKSQQETRHDDKVEGFYTLVEPDGHRRIVHYTANDHDGFNAKVDREYVGGHEQQQQHGQVHKIAIAAPAIHKVAIAAPSIQYTAPSYSSGSLGLSKYH